MLFLSLAGLEGYSQSSISFGNEVDDALVYPNPMTGEKFVVRSEKIISKIEVLNVIGKTINLTENDDFDIKEIPVLIGKCEKGMYFVKITYKDKKFRIKKLLVK